MTFSFKKYFIILLILWWALSAAALNHTWTGGAPNPNWNHPQNWDIGPPDSIDDNITINGNCTVYPILSSNLAINDLTINDGSFELSGAVLSIGGNLSIYGGNLHGDGSVAVNNDINIKKVYSTVNITVGTIILRGNWNNEAGDTQFKTIIGSQLIITGGGSVTMLTDAPVSHLRIDNANVLLRDSITIRGDLEILSGDLDSGGRDIAVTGNWIIDNGTFTHKNNLVTFYGENIEHIINPGNSSFFNLTLNNGSLNIKNYPGHTGDRLEINSSLLFDGISTYMDVNDINFRINRLRFNNTAGEFRLTGQQIEQIVMDTDTTIGTFVYQGRTEGMIGLTNFYNLNINKAGGMIGLDHDIEVNRDLSITAGTLSIRNSAGIRVGRNFHKEETGAAHFDPGTGTVEFIDSRTASNITGSNSFYNFICRTPGKTIRFDHIRSAVDSPLQTIVSGGAFRIDSTGIPINLQSTLEDPLSGPYPPARPGQWQINLSGTATSVIRNVNIDRGYPQTPVPLSHPDTVQLNLSYNWVQDLTVERSYTKDTDTDGTGPLPANGKIDAVEIETGGLTLNDDFSGLTITITDVTEGYEYRVKKIHTGLMANDGHFIVEFEEGPRLDTDTTPAWRIAANTSLRDFCTGTYLLRSKTREIPEDHAPPVMAYTLAIAGKDRIFLRFSEPVYSNTGGPLTADGFAYSGTGKITDLMYPEPENDKVILQLNQNLPEEDILKNETISIINTPLLDATMDVRRSILPGTPHRVSDLALGTASSAIVEPVWAEDTGGNGNRDSEIIRVFDGSTGLEDRDIQLQIRLGHESLSGSQVNLYYDIDVNNLFKNEALWLPFYTDTDFNGLVPSSNSGARILEEQRIPSTPMLRSYLFPSEDPEIKNGAEIEFLFHLPASNLICVRVKNSETEDWYNQIAPWSFGIHNITNQTNNVSILNNIINPGKGEAATLHYKLPETAMVNIRIFDLKGDIVNTLQAGHQEAGKHYIQWNGRNRGGRIVAPGVYFLKINAGAMEEMRKVMIVKD